MIVIDSSVLVSYWVEDDVNNSKAINTINRIAKGKFGNAAVSDYIFDETLTAILQKTKSVDKAVEAGNYINNSMRVLRVSDYEFEDAWTLFKGQRGTKFSFTDCSIMSLMKGQGFSNIATFDKEFDDVRNINVVT